MKEQIFIAVIADTRQVMHKKFQAVNEYYLLALNAGVEDISIIPFIIPTLTSKKEIIAPLLSKAHGLMLIGSDSNVHPSYYGKKGNFAPYNVERDEMAFAFIQTAFEKNIPCLGICRGIQEMNVAFGGSLHHEVEKLEGKAKHHPASKASEAEEYSCRHKVRFSEKGLLMQATGLEEADIYSIHLQAIDKLAPNLVSEAIAEDGTIEAVSAPEVDFMLGVQWHPEYKAEEEPVSRAIFSAFAKAALAYSKR